MADNTAVNSQITDSVTQANVEVLGNTPVLALNNLLMATAQALANAAHNATANQQQTNTIAQAVTAQCVAKILSLNTSNVIDVPSLQHDILHPKQKV